MKGSVSYSAWQTFEY